MALSYSTTTTCAPSMASPIAAGSSVQQNDSSSHKAIRWSLVPGGFRQFGPILARFAPRIMTAQGSPPDGAGRVNLALHLGATRPELFRAGRDPDRLLIVEVNPNLPQTKSLSPRFDNTIPLELIDVLIETDGKPFALEEPPPDEIDAAIARHAMRYVTWGATLQTGIGAIPNMIASELAAGTLGDFGIHSEMFTSGLMRLHRAGKVTNANKGIFDGVSVTTFALGTEELYRWLDGNEAVAFLDVDVVNDPGTISQNEKLVSINGALSVDLYGQVVADNIDGRQISGVGGHEDFVAGAEMRLDAHSLVCLRSTALVDGEQISRITGVLPAGSIVSTPRHHLGTVVTEFGAAELADSRSANGLMSWSTLLTLISAANSASSLTGWGVNGRDSVLSIRTLTRFDRTSGHCVINRSPRFARYLPLRLRYSVSGPSEWRIADHFTWQGRERVRRRPVPVWVFVASSVIATKFAWENPSALPRPTIHQQG